MPPWARYKSALMKLDTAAALEALKKVKDPELHRDVVSLGMIKDLVVDGGFMANATRHLTK